MLSVLLLGFDAAGRQAAAPGEAVRTLAALVPAAVEGVVRDLCLAGPDDTGLPEVADHAGCAFASAGTPGEAFAAGAQRLRSPQVLVTHAGLLIDRAVIEELATLLPLLDGAGSAAWVLRSERRDLLGRLFPGSSPVAGLICARTWLMQSGAGSLAALARRAPGRRTLRTRALAGP